MTFEFAHNFLRKLMNLEGGQLSFLTEAQKDNFYANPHTFFIRADDETARAIWDVLYPKPKEPAAAEAAKEVATRSKVIDLDAFRKAVDALPRMPEKPRDYRYWSPPRTPADPTLGGGNADFKYDAGRVYPLPAPVTSNGAKSTTPHDTWSAGYYDRAG